MGAKEIGLVAVPGAGPPSVDPRPPVPILLAVALTAKTVGFLESHRSAAGQMQLVPVFLIVAIQAPAILFIVPQNDVRVEGSQWSTVGICRDHAVAPGTRKDTWRERWGRYLHPFLGGCSCLEGKGGLAGRFSLGRRTAATQGEESEENGHSDRPWEGDSSAEAKGKAGSPGG